MHSVGTVDSMWSERVGVRFIIRNSSAVTEWFPPVEHKYPSLDIGPPSLQTLPQTAPILAKVQPTAHNDQYIIIMKASPVQSLC